jgi:hypothetical protein
MLLLHYRVAPLFRHYSVAPAASALQCSPYYFCITVYRMLLLHYREAPPTSVMQK